MRDKLVQRCRQRSETFSKLGDTIETQHGPLTYIDNGADILAVAHRDYVMWRKPKIKKDTIFCPQLDDRLGIWVILDVLKELNVKVDVLITDSEEIGLSTSMYFDPPKQYKWMFQFDRAGTDAVMYQYEDNKCHNRLLAIGYKVGSGSFSDICYLDHLGCAGFNVGVGYHLQHSNKCYANLIETQGCVEKFLKFYRKYKNVEMPYTYTMFDKDVYHDDDYLMEDERYLDDLAIRWGYRDGKDYMESEGIFDTWEAICTLEDIEASIKN